MKTKFEIKTFGGSLLFTYEGESLKETLVQAVKQGADLRGADLQGAYLQGADLQGAHLQGAYLQGAYLRGADLRGAYLQGADLQGAYLQGAYLQGAYLQGADLQGAENIPVIALAQSSIVPDDGPIHGWKKCANGVIVHLAVGSKARRSNAFGRKCRAEYVKVLEVYGAEVGISLHDGRTEYRKGRIVRCDKWNEDRWTECGGGIHFYLTRAEAEAHI